MTSSLHCEHVSRRQRWELRNHVDQGERPQIWNQLPSRVGPAVRGGQPVPGHTQRAGGPPELGSAGQVPPVLSAPRYPARASPASPGTLSRSFCSSTTWLCRAFIFSL